MIKRILAFLFGRKDLERTGNNDYFESSTYHVSPGERARVAHLNDAVDAIEAALDKLPSETAMRANTSHYAVDTGAANAYAVALSYYSAVAYTDGMGITFKATNTNSGASTLNVNGLGAKLITRQDGSGLAAGDIPENKIVSVRYNSTSDNFEVHGAPAAGAGSMAAQNASAVTITGGSITGITDLAVADGGSGASTASGALTNFGLTAIAAEVNATCDGNTATAAEITQVCDGNTATAAEISQLHSQGAVAADFAKLHAAGATLVDTTTAQNIAGPKVFTDGLTITGAALKVGPATGIDTQITGSGTARQTVILGGPYTGYTGDSALIVVRSKDEATTPGTVALFGAQSGVGVNEGLRVKTDGIVNLPVGLEIGGVAVGGEVAVSQADGYPAINITLFTPTTLVAEEAWESVGPTGSGADNTWAALDDVPAGADWIRVYIKGTANGGPSSSSVTLALHGRKTGTSGGPSNATEILYISGFTDSSGGDVSSGCIEATIPIDSSRRFDAYWVSSYTGSNSAIMRLVAYGKN